MSTHIWLTTIGTSVWKLHNSTYLPWYAIRDVQFDFYNVENLYIWQSGSKKLTENKKEEISETTENGKNGENSKMAISFQDVGQKFFFGQFYVH